MASLGGGGNAPTSPHLASIFASRVRLTTGIDSRSQRLHWTLAKLNTPEQCERWSDLMPLLTWQLWLARELVIDNPLPWQKSIANKLTPGRVAQSVPGVLAAIGTPAQPPKSRGKSPGWPTGQPRRRKIRCPIVKKGTSRPKKQQSKSA
jgi:hypothetical protein